MMDEMRKTIQSFQETKNFTTLNNHEVLIVYDYVKQKKHFNNHPNENFEPILKLDPYRVELVPSKAYQEELDKKDKLKNIDTLYNANYVLEADLDDFVQSNEERKEAYQMAKTFIDNFEKNKFIKGLYFHGQNRTGKTFLISAVANELSKKGVSIIFAYVPDLVRNIHSGIGDNSVETKVEQLKYCDLLILDDLGSVKMSLWFRDQIFGSVIQHRLSTGAPIIITSNLELRQLADFLVDDSVSNDKYNAVRIITRIEEMTETVKLSAYRYKK